MEYDKKIGRNYVNRLVRSHGITVTKYSVTSSGVAWRNTRMIKIPKPTNLDRFGVCLHEIYHVIGKKLGTLKFEQEFYCDKYALDIMIKFGLNTDAWIKRMKWHVLSRMAMAHNRGLNHSKIKPEIKEFFSDIDFNKWIGNSVWVGREYYETLDPNRIVFVEKKEVLAQRFNLKQ